MSHFRSALRVTATAAAAAMLVAGCSSTPGQGTIEPANSSSKSTVAMGNAIPTFPSPQPPRPSSTGAIPSEDAATLASQFTMWAEKLPGNVAVSVAPVGSGTPLPLNVELGQHVAWSTIKVPLALATIRARSDPTGAYVTAALTESDNAAAESLWSSLGAASSAADAVQAVLRGGGDATTTVQQVRVRPGFTPFGQTVWSVNDQAAWASRLPCFADGSSVLRPMRNVVSGQRWGFGSLPGAAIKGGWGPDESGSYLVRQFAIIEHRTGQTAISVVAEPASGTFAGGINLIDRVAQWIVSRIGELPGGSCA